MAHDVFISYAKEDEQTADVVCQALEDDGVVCWYAPRDIPPGRDYEESIIDAISTSRLVVLILSSHSNNSPHVKREIQNACIEGASIPIIPFRTEEISLNKALRYYLGSLQWIDASAPPSKDHIQYLVEQVKIRVPNSSPAPEEPWLNGSAELETRERRVGDISILDLSGRIIIGEGCIVLRLAIRRLIDERKKQILLNLAGVIAIDSAGLGEMINSYCEITRHGGQLKFLKINERLQNLFMIQKLVAVFEVFETEAEALNSFIETSS